MSAANSNRGFEPKGITSIDSNPNSKNERMDVTLNRFDALDLIGKSNRAVISLGSQEYILRLTKQHKLILTK